MSERLTLPSMVTLIGFAIGAIGVLSFPYEVCVVPLMLSLVLDVIDGRLARAFDCETELGARLDWWSDVVLGNWLVVALLLHAHPAAAGASIGCLVARQLVTAIDSYVGGATRWRIRASGRALVTLIVLWVVCHG